MPVRAETKERKVWRQARPLKGLVSHVWLLKLKNLHFLKFHKK